jgi:hypothetical protein
MILDSELLKYAEDMRAQGAKDDIQDWGVSSASRAVGLAFVGVGFDDEQRKVVCEWSEQHRLQEQRRPEMSLVPRGGSHH